MRTAFEHKQRLNYRAWIAEDGKPLRVCNLEEVTARGASISVKDATSLPNAFKLLLALNATTCRECQVVGRNGDRIDVEFASTMRWGDTTVVEV